MENAKIPQDMIDALAKFDSTAKQIIDSFCKTLESQEPPQTIYHYTNDVGLKGILETGQLWLSDIFNLNDPSELSHGFSHAVKILNNKAANGPPDLPAGPQKACVVPGCLPCVARTIWAP